MMWVYDTYRGWTNKSNYINKILHGEIDHRTRLHIENTILSLEEIRLLAEAHGTDLALAVIPVATQLTNTFPNQKYQSQLRQYAMKAGLDFIDLLPGLRSHYDRYQESLVIPFDGHYNGKGHSAMAKSVFDYLDSLTLCH